MNHSHLLASYDPDIICVEIRPKDFRKTMYLKEMLSRQLMDSSRILRHLELIFEAERPPPPHYAQQEPLMAAEESWEYFREPP